MKDTLTCDESNLQDYSYNIECMKAASLFGIYSCIITLFMSCMVLLFYTVDPMDRGLLINEQCIYLTSTYSDFKKVTSVNRFIMSYYQKHDNPVGHNARRLNTRQYNNERANSEMSSGT